MNLTRLAPKVFVIGSAIGGASGIAPIVKVGQSGSSVLTHEEVKRMHFYKKGETGVCFGYDEYSGKLARADDSGDHIRLVFWLQHGDKDGCRKFIGGKKSELIKGDMEKNGYYKVTLKKTDWEKLVETLAQGRQAVKGVLDILEKAMVSSDEQDRSATEGVQSILEKVQRILSKQEMDARKRVKGEKNLRINLKLYESFLTNVIATIKNGPMGQWTWMKGKGAQLQES